MTTRRRCWVSAARSQAPGRGVCVGGAQRRRTLQAGCRRWAAAVACLEGGVAARRCQRRRGDACRAARLCVICPMDLSIVESPSTCPTRPSLRLVLCLPLPATPALSPLLLPAADQNIIDDTEYSEFQAPPSSGLEGGMLRVPSTAATLAPRGTSPPAPSTGPAAAAADGTVSPAPSWAGGEDGEEPAQKRQRKAVHWAEEGGEQQQPPQQQHQWQQQAPPGG